MLAIYYNLFVDIMIVTLPIILLIHIVPKFHILVELKKKESQIDNLKKFIDIVKSNPEYLEMFDKLFSKIQEDKDALVNNTNETIEKKEEIIINKLPKILDNKCPICLDHILYNYDNLVQLNCGHIYNLSCIEESSKHSTLCSVCKKTFNCEFQKSWFLENLFKECSSIESINELIVLKKKVNNLSKPGNIIEIIHKYI